MTVTPSSLVVGIFKERSMAEQAIDALHTAGFTSEQVRYSPPGTSGSILADLKNMFTGQNASSGNIINDLTDMGLSDEEAQYYSNEHNNGNTILAVSAPGREQEALNALHQYGAYNARTSDSSPAETTSSTQQSSDYNQQTSYTPNWASNQQSHAPDWATQQQPSTAEDHPFQNAQQDATPSVSSTEAQDYQPGEASVAEEPTEPLASGYHSTSPQVTSDDVVTPDATSEAQNIPSDTVPSDSTYEPQAVPSDTAASDSMYEPQATQTDDVAALNSVPPQTWSSDTVATDSAPAPQATPSDMTAEHTDELQQIQAQLQAAQQQLQDAKAQLQAAKDHEAQIQIIREREQQLQTARQQLQDIQVELQATLAELHETHGRLGQYQ